MERRFETRLQEMLLQAEVPTDLVKGLMDRVSTFVEPFARSLSEPEQRQHTVEYIQGLLSKLDRKTGEFLKGFPIARQTWAKGLDSERVWALQWVLAGEPALARVRGRIGERDGHAGRVGGGHVGAERSRERRDLGLRRDRFTRHLRHLRHLRR